LFSKTQGFSLNTQGLFSNTLTKIPKICALLVKLKIRGEKPLFSVNVIYKWPLKKQSKQSLPIISKNVSVLSIHQCQCCSHLSLILSASSFLISWCVCSSPCLLFVTNLCPWCLLFCRGNPACELLVYRTSSLGQERV